MHSCLLFPLALQWQCSNAKVKFSSAANTTKVPNICVNMPWKGYTFYNQHNSLMTNNIIYVHAQAQHAKAIQNWKGYTVLIEIVCKALYVALSCNVRVCQ